MPTRHDLVCVICHLLIEKMKSIYEHCSVMEWESSIIFHWKCHYWNSLTEYYFFSGLEPILQSRWTHPIWTENLCQVTLVIIEKKIKMTKRAYKFHTFHTVYFSEHHRHSSHHRDSHNPIQSRSGQILWIRGLTRLQTQVSQSFLISILIFHAPDNFLTSALT